MTSRPAAGSNEVDKNHFQEHEFAVDVDLRATPHQVTIIQLEPPESSLNPLSDTGIPGVDVIPYVFDETARRTFTVENKQGAAHTLLFLNANDEVLLRVSSETPTVTQVIPAGRYTIEVYHGGISRAQQLFIRPHNPILSTDCPNCDLRFADLHRADLRGGAFQSADLSHANLRQATLFGAQLADANLQAADLRGADLSPAFQAGRETPVKANLNHANLRAASLSRADLREADLREADLWRADLREAILFGVLLQNADLRSADLLGAHLSGADLSGADLSGAIWVDGRRCDEGSIGSCE